MTGIECVEFERQKAMEKIVTTWLFRNSDKIYRKYGLNKFLINQDTVEFLADFGRHLAGDC